MTFLLMCIEFFKIGLFAIGGGLATIPFLQELSIKYGWFTLEDITTMVAVSESTPGPIGVNMATYVGNHMFGLLGGIAATLSLVSPAIIVICIIAKILEKFKESKVVKGIFIGLRPAVVGLILSVVVSIFLKTLFHIDVFQESNQIIDLFNWKALILFICLGTFYMYKEKMHPIVLIILAATVGIFFGF